MTTTTRERRRNMRPESCRACGAMCEPGNGYLYSDTNTTRRSRYTGRFLWFVKCEACHSGSKTRMTVRMEKDANVRASEPIVRPWSVSQVKTWSVSQIEHEGGAAIRVESGAFSEIVSYRDRINGRFTAPTGYALEQSTISGRPLSENAATYLSPKILAIVEAIQSEETESGEKAAFKLVDAGAVVAPHQSGNCWKVALRGGNYTLWGCVDGTNKLSGLTQDSKWIETTAEELIFERDVEIVQPTEQIAKS